MNTNCSRIHWRVLFQCDLSVNSSKIRPTIFHCCVDTDFQSQLHLRNLQKVHCTCYVGHRAYKYALSPLEFGGAILPETFKNLEIAKPSTTKAPHCF
jgi:hypothetical protein